MAQWYEFIMAQLREVNSHLASLEAPRNIFCKVGAEMLLNKGYLIPQLDTVMLA